jgi:hypothetical protein
MSKRCFTEEIVLPREYIKEEIFIDIGTSVEDYLKSLKKESKSAETKKKQLNFILLQDSKTDIMKKCLLKKKNYLEIN